MALAKDRVRTVNEALGLIRDGDHVVAAMAAAEPQGLFAGIGERSRQLGNVTLHCANPSRSYPCFTAPGLGACLEINIMFLTAPVRSLQGHGRIHYVPQHLSQWARNLTRRRAPDVFWGTCSPPDARGFVSLGTGACYEPEILRAARQVVLEINPCVPVTAGATTVPISWVDHFVEHERPLPTVERPRPDNVDHQIAQRVAELIPDGATIQFGISAIPNALGKALETKHDLGVHTEMINDTVMDLSLAGVITGRRKSLWPGKIVGSFVYGTAELYSFVNGHPLIDLQPASLVNDPSRIGRNHSMISVNSAVEVDLTGQVCSESIGHCELSGVGGAFETHTGAQRSAGGRGIIALRSTTVSHGAPVSKIVFELKPGAKVSVSRNDVDTIVTEFGVAELAGLSVGQRVKAMARIAHPDFRGELTSKARRAGYL